MTHQVWSASLFCEIGLVNVAYDEPHSLFSGPSNQPLSVHFPEPGGHGHSPWSNQPLSVHLPEPGGHGHGVWTIVCGKVNTCTAHTHTHTTCTRTRTNRHTDLNIICTVSSILLKYTVLPQSSIDCHWEVHGGILPGLPGACGLFGKGFNMQLLLRQLGTATVQGVTGSNVLFVVDVIVPVLAKWVRIVFTVCGVLRHLTCACMHAAFVTTLVPAATC